MSQSAQDLRDEALCALTRKTGARGSFLCRFERTPDRRLRYHSVHCQGAPTLRTVFKSLEGRPVFGGPGPASLDLLSRNTPARFRPKCKSFEHGVAWVPTDDFGALGWLGVVGDQMPLRLPPNTVKREVCRLLSDAQHLDDAERIPDGAVFILNTHGTTLDACAEATGWLNSSTYRTQLMAGLQRRPAIKRLGLGNATLTLLPFAGSPAVVVTVRRVGETRLPLVRALTHRQTMVAERAASGSCARSIAKALNLSVETVRDHLAATYQRLDIGCRAELARHILEATR